MKAKASRETPAFKSIELNITIENENELNWYLALFNISKMSLVDIDRNFSILTDPDPHGKIVDMLEDAKKS
jgi:hypothetical protein